MSTKELKEKIHELVETTPESYLKDVHAILDDLNNGEIIPELGCTKAQYNRELDEGLAAYRRGEWISQEEAMAQIDKRLEKYKNGSSLD